MQPKEVAHFRHATISWQLSQFLHGEQGALITASQLVGAVPWADAKYYAASQTMDEARHVEVFSRYVREKLEWEWPINPNLKRLLDIILMDSRWDLKYLGMQILVEGLAMAAFANLHQLAEEPLVKELIHYVMRDEARHVAFGVLSLKGYYQEMPANELADREDFVIEACLLMRDRLVGEEIAEAIGFDPVEVRDIILDSPIMQMFRQALFARVVPNIKRLGSAHAARARRLRGDADHPVRGRRPRGPGPRARTDPGLARLRLAARGLAGSRGAASGSPLHRQDRAGRLLDDALGDAAEQQVLEPGEPVRADHDQVGALRLGLVDDHRRGVALAHDGFDVEPLLAQLPDVASRGSDPPPS